MRLVRRLACLGTLAVAAHGVPAQGVPAQTTPGTAERDGDALVLRGYIDAAVAQRAVQLLRNPDITRVVVTSAGGEVEATLDIAETMHANFKNVEVPLACLASCANYIFPAGRHKLLARAGVVGWRGTMAYVLYQQRANPGRWSDTQMREVRRLAQREAGFYARLGVDGFVAWFGKLPPYSVEEFYTLSVQDMEGFGLRNLRVRDADAALSGGLMQEVQVDWARLESLRPRASPDP